ncbi:aldehyde dehydrogenase family protein [Thalassotalea sp. PLHSN55]|uniref:aldehyde dehydrogenase family protein n=1 Tax=Thalassotalea sp. PLHSN55 TaxID=3435888 RepID=UPI003F8480F5
MTKAKLSKSTLDFLEPMQLPFFSNGDWQTSAQAIDVIDPATSEKIASVSLASARDIDQAIDSAANAFTAWSTQSITLRTRCLRNLAQLIQRDEQILAELECIDVGKPISAALEFDVPFAADCFSYFANVAEDFEYTSNNNLTTTDSHVVKLPYGVAGFVFPWNFPLTLCAWGIAPALAAGNTVVVKPASETPLSSLYLAKLCQEAGFPAGVVNILPGQGSVAGEALISSQKIKLMSFTGSTAVGKHVAEVCGRNLVPAKLELGGKGAAIVCNDANVDHAVENLSGAVTLNAGQVCCTASRWYIHEDIYQEFVDKAKAKYQSTKVLNGAHPEAEMGPICTEKQLSQVLNCIKEAKEQGAKVLCGGNRITHGEYANGYFIEPTLLAGSDDNTWAQEEIFGPVAFLLKFSDEDEVINRANQNPYGLANSVWTTDSDKAIKLAHSLVGGNSWINAHNVFEYGLNYGACNQSGCGGGVNSVATFEGYLRHQSIASVR